MGVWAIMERSARTVARNRLLSLLHDKMSHSRATRYRDHTISNSHRFSNEVPNVYRFEELQLRGRFTRFWWIAGKWPNCVGHKLVAWWLACDENFSDEMFTSCCDWRCVNNSTIPRPYRHYHEKRPAQTPNITDRTQLQYCNLDNIMSVFPTGQSRNQLGIDDDDNGIIENWLITPIK